MARITEISSSNIFAGSAGGGGRSFKSVTLLSITTAPTGTFAKGSKYYDSTTKKIYTAKVANSWTGAKEEDPKFYTIYLYDNDGTTEYYKWDGDNLITTDLERYEEKENKTNSYIETSTDKYPSSKAMYDGLASQGDIVVDYMAATMNDLPASQTAADKAFVLLSGNTASFCKGDGNGGWAWYTPEKQIKIGTKVYITSSNQLFIVTIVGYGGAIWQEVKPIDSELSSSSENAVQNKVVKGALDNKQAKIAAGTANNIVAYSGTEGTVISLERKTAVRSSQNASDEAIPTEKAVATLGELKEDKSNKVTEITVNSTDQQYPSAKAVYDKINSSARRLQIHLGYDGTVTKYGGAIGRNFTASTDVAAGTDDFKDHPVFEQYECIGRYDSVSGKWETHLKDTFEWSQYKNTPGWEAGIAKRIFFPSAAIADDSGVFLDLGVIKEAGDIELPAFKNADGSYKEWIFIGKYEVCQPEGEADGGCCTRSGCIPLVNKTVQQYEGLLRPKHERLMTVDEVTVIQILGMMKYGGLDWQAKIGQGVSNGWKETKAAVAQTDATSVIILATNLPASLEEYPIGNGLWIGGTGYKILSIEDITETINEESVACKKINIDGTVTTTTNTTVYLGAVLSGLTDDVLGLDGHTTKNGAITSSTRMPNLVLGLENWFANLWTAIGNSEVIIASGVSKMYVNPNPDGEDYAYTSSQNDKNWAEVGEIGKASGNNLKFVPSASLSRLAFLPSANSGNKHNDYAYLTASNGQYSVWYGGSCDDGASDGGFYWTLNAGLSATSRRRGARCVWLQ